MNQQLPLLCPEVSESCCTRWSAWFFLLLSRGSLSSKSCSVSIYLESSDFSCSFHLALKIPPVSCHLPSFQASFPFLLFSSFYLRVQDVPISLCLLYARKQSSWDQLLQSFLRYLILTTLMLILMASFKLKPFWFSTCFWFRYYCQSLKQYILLLLHQLSL